MSVLKQGSSGPDVTALQTKLKQLGFDPRGVDGNFGPGTTSALIAFQKSKGLTADGKAGPATMAALQSAGGGSVASSGSAGGAGTSTASAAATAPNLNLAALTGLLPASVIAQIPETAQKFGITSDLRLAHFLAQCALESMEFKATVEKLGYSSSERILKVFRKYFKTVDPAPYVNNPAKLANRVYANRMGNGDEASGDGFNFRGRGYIQLKLHQLYQLHWRGLRRQSRPGRH